MRMPSSFSIIHFSGMFGTNLTGCACSCCSARVWGWPRGPTRDPYEGIFPPSDWRVA
jgi:hypothetical protein